MDPTAVSGAPAPVACLPEPHLASPRARILVIDDDCDLADEVVKDLQHRGYAATAAYTRTQGADAVRRGVYDLLIIDLILPEGDGFSLIRGLRRDGCRVPMLVVSALNAVSDKVRGLRSGGDDYVTKPFALSEIAARVEALLRRPQDAQTTILRVGPLELDLIERVARRDDRVISLSKSEFKLLEYFMRRPDQVVPREMLLEGVWACRASSLVNLVDVHIGQLRRKIDKASREPMLLSIRGMGFILRDPK